MKELSIEEKAKAYDESLEKARKLKDEYNDIEGYYPNQWLCEELFPELKESENEKIRKELINFLKHYPNIIVKKERRNDWIAWLENQGEQSAELKPVVGIEIPYGAKDSELCGATYFIPSGFHAEIEGDKVLIKKGEQKSAWSEEDENKLSSVLFLLHEYKNYNFDIWLKSLRPQNIWKPSDEQMKLLREVQQALLGKDCHNRFVDFMYELKRLREE